MKLEEAIAKYGSTKVYDLITDLSKFYALPPYNVVSNYVAYDGYFSASIKSKYPEELIEVVIKHLNV